VPPSITNAELEALREVGAQRLHRTLSRTMADRLIALGLIDETVRGFRLTAAGEARLKLG
jgi:hypothetical protein